MKRKPRKMAHLFAFLCFLRYVQEIGDDPNFQRLAADSLLGQKWKAQWVAPAHADWMPKGQIYRELDTALEIEFSGRNAKRRYFR